MEYKNLIGKIDDLINKVVLKTPTTLIPHIIIDNVTKVCNIGIYMTVEQYNSVININSGTINLNNNINSIIYINRDINKIERVIEQIKMYMYDSNKFNNNFLNRIPYVYDSIDNMPHVWYNNVIELLEHISLLDTTNDEETFNDYSDIIDTIFDVFNMVLTIYDINSEGDYKILINNNPIMIPNFSNRFTIKKLNIYNDNHLNKFNVLNNEESNKNIPFVFSYEHLNIKTLMEYWDYDIFKLGDTIVKISNNVYEKVEIDNYFDTPITLKLTDEYNIIGVSESYGDIIDITLENSTISGLNFNIKYCIDEESFIDDDITEKLGIETINKLYLFIETISYQLMDIREEYDFSAKEIVANFYNNILFYGKLSEHCTEKQTDNFKTLFGDSGIYVGKIYGRICLMFVGKHHKTNHLIPTYIHGNHVLLNTEQIKPENISLLSNVELTSNFKSIYEYSYKNLQFDKMIKKLIN